MGGVLRQRDSGADADLEHAAANLVGRLNRRLAALAEYPAEHEVINRRPAVIGLFERLAVEVQLPGVGELCDFRHGILTRYRDRSISCARRVCSPRGGQVAANGSAATLSDWR